MTISIWRYSHLLLAISSFLFIALASVTGAILSVEAVQDGLLPYKAVDPGKVTVAEVIPVLKNKFAEVSKLELTEHGYVLIHATDSIGEEVHAYINPSTGVILGHPAPPSKFFQWVTALHRSLFLHEPGRFFIGLTAFLLCLITLTGIVLVVKRQHGLRHFWRRISRDSFAQYYHVVLGRLMLIPLLILAATGTWLSLERFGIMGTPAEGVSEFVMPAHNTEAQRTALTDFPVFQETRLSDLRSMEFPFLDDDPDEYFVLRLRDRELRVEQFSGHIVGNQPYPFQQLATELNLRLHTGRSSIIWAVLIAVASLSTLFFIYSGFLITIRRRRGRFTNRVRAADASIVILAGSENGSTFLFAKSVHEQLLRQGKKSFLTEPNKWSRFPKLEQLIVFTATHGLGDPPSNANRFLRLLETIGQENHVQVSVLGFGSRQYPDFCGFARQIQESLSTQSWVKELLPLHTVEDRSPDQFVQWVRTWSSLTGIVLNDTAATYRTEPSRLTNWELTDRTEVSVPGDSFLLTLRPLQKNRFRSGDLLAVYPAGDHRERFYSISRVGNKVQLLVKYYESGLGSTYLNALRVGDRLPARIVQNPSFHFPRHAASVVLISNGTGIAPFLGMIAENRRGRECRLYAGFSQESSLTREYRSYLASQVKKGFLTKFDFALSREGEQIRVMNLIQKDADHIAQQIQAGGIVLICGSLAMQQDVEHVLNDLLIQRTAKPLSWYREKGQLQTDCY